MNTKNGVVSNDETIKNMINFIKDYYKITLNINIDKNNIKLISNDNIAKRGTIFLVDYDKDKVQNIFQFTYNMNKRKIELKIYTELIPSYIC